MVLSIQKLARPLKFPSNSDALWASLGVFRSNIFSFISQTWSKPEAGFEKCFELIQMSSRAFAELVVEIDYPMIRWGGKLSEEYLNYTLNLLNMLNSVNSSVSHLHALSLIKDSPHSLKKIPTKNLYKDFKSIRIEERPGSDKETVLLQAVTVSKKIGFLALGRVLSGLCSDAKPYMEARKCAGGFDDSLIKDLDSRFFGMMMEEVNRAIDVDELKMRFEVLEKSIEGIEKQANHLFYQVLAARNKLLDNIRLTG